MHETAFTFSHLESPAAGATLPPGRHVLRGWVAYYAWSGANELAVLEGKDDLHGRLSRLRLDQQEKISDGMIPLIYSYWHVVLLTRFDVHPDGRRIATEALESHQADISLIEGIR